MSKYKVCPDCEGEGTKGPGFVYTAQDVEEMGYEAFDEVQFMHREGMFDTVCEFCEGKRVVTVERAAEWDDELEYRAERAAEMRAGC